jgi:AraC-like DNA-binding protein
MFLKHTGFTLQQYIIHIRMEKAVDLLLHSNQTISEIGYSVGGYSIHYFSRLFRKKMGLTPSDYRNP